MDKKTIVDGTTLVELWDLLPEGAEEVLLGLEYDGKKGEQEADVPGIGRVTSWIDECSEGADRGGYVQWARLHDVVGPTGKPVVLESETDGGEFLFSGRMSTYDVRWA